MELFADDTNALVAKEEESLKEFWDCLNIFCKASGSTINHRKTGIICKGGGPPQWIAETGCRRFQEGEIFRLLGIPMGHKVSLQERWKWVMNKVEVKLARWQKRKLNLAGRRMIINHYIIPLLVYYISCWRPTDAQLKEFVALCRNFLWGGGPLD